MAGIVAVFVFVVDVVVDDDDDPINISLQFGLYRVSNKQQLIYYLH